MHGFALSVVLSVVSDFAMLVLQTSMNMQNNMGMLRPST